MPKRSKTPTPDPYAELRVAVGMEPRIELGNDVAIAGQLELDNEEGDERDR